MLEGVDLLVCLFCFVVCVWRWLPTARSPVAVGLHDVSVKTQGRLTLRCRTRGNPLPAMAWFKDGQPLHATKRVRIKSKR